MKQGRPIGQRIRQCCEIVEKIGPCSYREVLAHMVGVQLENSHKYCSRALSHGLLTSNREKFPAQYSIVDGWRDLIDANGRTKKPKPRAVSRSEFKPRQNALDAVWFPTGA